MAADERESFTQFGWLSDVSQKRELSLSLPAPYSRLNRARLMAGYSAGSRVDRVACSTGRRSEPLVGPERSCNCGRRLDRSHRMGSSCSRRLGRRSNSHDRISGRCSSVGLGNRCSHRSGSNTHECYGNPADGDGRCSPSCMSRMPECRKDQSDTVGRIPSLGSDQIHRSCRPGSWLRSCRVCSRNCRRSSHQPAEHIASWSYATIHNTVHMSRHKPGHNSDPSSGNRRNPTTRAQARETCDSSFPLTTAESPSSAREESGCAPRGNGQYNLYRRHNPENPANRNLANPRYLGVEG